MLGPYENISPKQSMLRPEGEQIISTVAFDRFPGQDDSRKNYNGPGEAWWGCDMIAVDHGKGRMLMTTLEMDQHLAKDPVADKLLINMVNYI